MADECLLICLCISDDRKCFGNDSLSSRMTSYTGKLQHPSFLAVEIHSREDKAQGAPSVSQPAFRLSSYLSVKTSTTAPWKDSSMSSICNWVESNPPHVLTTSYGQNENIIPRPQESRPVSPLCHDYKFCATRSSTRSLWNILSFLIW